MRQFLGWMTALVLGSACRSLDTFVPASNDVDRGIVFAEHAGKEVIPIGDRTTPVVPAPVGVDVNSSIGIVLDRPTLARAAADAQLLQQLEALGTQSASVRRVLEFLERSTDALTRDVGEAEALLDLSFEERQVPETRARLDDLIRRTNDFELQLLDWSDELFPAGTPLGAEVDEVLGGAITGTPAGIAKIANRELARLETEYREIEGQLAESSSARKLRIEAFLHREEGEDPVAVHVPGYDDIAAERVRSHDRLGLNLDEEQRKKLADGVDASIELSNAANRVRRKQARLEDALAELQTEGARRVGELVQRIAAVKTTLEPECLRQRWQALEGAVRTLLEALAADLEASAAGQAVELRKLTDEHWEGLLLELEGPMAEALSLFQRAEALHAQLGNLSSASLVGFLSDLAKWTGDAQKFLREARSGALLRNTVERMDKLAEEVVALLSDEATALPASVRTRWERSEAKTELVAFRDDVGRVHELLEGLVRAFTGTRQQWRQEPVRSLAGLDVDLTSAPDSHIDLRGVARGEGDELLVKTTLLLGDEVLGESRATFVVTRYGYHAKIEPGVALVEADQLAGADDEGGFSPIVTWMHTYRPRPRQDSFGHELLRIFEPSVGIHAALLNYAIDNDPELGLGVTTGFWGQRLQLGYGYNLQADGRDDGEFYAYVGSSLFALLHDAAALGSGGD